MAPVWKLDGANLTTDDGFDGFHNHFDVTQSPLPIAATPEYDLADQEFSYGGIHTTPSKKQRSGDSPLSGLSSRIGTKFASFSRKWKNRQGPEAVIAVDRLDQPIRARANSASSTIVSPAVSSISRRDSHIPPSPARTVFEERLSESGVAPIDIQKANDQSEEEQEGQARTPLLPPLMVDFPSYLRDSPVQSPLQSPTVADAAESSKLNTPVESQTPRLPGLPSPPLSSNPSMSSVHRHFASQVVPSTEIPPIHIADPNDEWSRKLGHANFNIHPEPYTPETFDAESYKQSRANWDLARCNYTKHLFRTGEHYGTTSKIYRLTEEKWAEVDTQWKQSNQLIVSNLQDGGNDDEMGLAIEAQDPAPEAMKVPPLDDPTGKFPQLGDEDIVGPMAVGPALYRDPTPPQSRPSRKRNFLRFLQDFLGRSTASSQRP